MHEAIGRHEDLLRARLRAVAALALVSLILLAVRPVDGAQGEHTWSLLVEYSGLFASSDDETGHGGGLGAEYRYALNDFVAVGAIARYGVLTGAGSDPRHLLSLSATAVYTIDALAWVPWLGLGVGLYGLVPGDSPLDGGAALGVGLDYRRHRRFAVGAEVWLHALFNRFDDLPAVITAGLRLSWIHNR